MHCFINSDNYTVINNIKWSEATFLRPFLVIKIYKQFIVFLKAQVFKLWTRNA